MIDKGQLWEFGQDTGVTPLLFTRSALGFLMTTESQDLGLTSHLKDSAFLQYSVPVTIWRFSTAWYGRVRFGTVHFWGVFHWVLYLVPGTFLVPPQPRFQASRTVTKTWRVNSTDHWLAGENRHYCVNELASWDPPLQPDPLDLNQHSQRRIGRNFCLNKRTFLHQPQNSSVVVCWGSSDVPLVDSRGADPVRAWWRDAEEKSLMYITLLLNLLYFQSMFSVYIFTFVSVFCFN